MMSYQTPFVRRQVRKLLLFICGNKDKYRQLRDLHALVSHVQVNRSSSWYTNEPPEVILCFVFIELSLFHFQSVQQCCNTGGYDPLQARPHSITLPYDSLVELIEHLKCCVEIATSRTGNWQRFCLKQNTVLSYLLTISTLLDEGVSATVLQLLQCAICSTTKPRDTKAKVSFLFEMASIANLTRYSLVFRNLKLLLIPKSDAIVKSLKILTLKPNLKRLNA